MKILAIADVEEDWLTSARALRERAADVDLIVSCGDLPASYLECIVTLANVPLAYVRGNHDAAYDRRPPGGCVSIEGAVKSYGGLRLMGLGGSMRYNDRVWGFSEQEMARRAAGLSIVARATGGIDLLVTHAPARGYGDLDDLPHQGFEAFNTLLRRLRPRFMLHGHVHLSYGRLARTVAHPSGTVIVNVYGSQVIEIPDDEIPARGGRGLFRIERI